MKVIFNKTPPVRYICDHLDDVLKAVIVMFKNLVSVVTKKLKILVTHGAKFRLSSKIFQRISYEYFRLKFPSMYSRSKKKKKRRSTVNTAPN